jgi:crossover junction endodeoxyribonuclease RuvC
VSSSPAPLETRRILGVDPGSRTTGWGLVETGKREPRLLDCGVIRLAADGRRPELAERLRELQRALAAIVDATRPDCAAVETPYLGADARAALWLAQARGVILATLAATGLGVAEYSPATVKKAVTGNGRAPKEQVRAMVGRLLAGARPEDRSTDLSDALAVALCHASCWRHAELLRRLRDDAGGSVLRGAPARPIRP